MAEEIQGRLREADTEVTDLAIGDYLLREGRGQMAMSLPTGAVIILDVVEGADPGTPKTWGFEQHSDGAITMTPSIHAHGPDEWHGHLVHGIWKSV